MNKFAKLISLLAAILILISSCTDTGNDSPYSDIFSQPAFAPLTDSISKEPKNDELYFRRAILLNQKNFPEPALVDFQKAWSLKKEEKYAFGISTLLGNSKPDSAILFLNQALAILPNSFLLQLSLARAYAARNETDAALQTCNLILDRNPQQVDVLKLKADLLGKKGNSTERIFAWSSGR